MNYLFDKEETQYEKVITEAITAIRDGKKLPGRNRIVKHVESKYGLSANGTLEGIERLLSDTVIYIKYQIKGKSHSTCQN